MMNLIKPFLGASLFIPHGHCYLWKPELVGLHVLSDALIALAYYSISLTLIYIVRKRQGFPFTSVFLLFSAFIVACGTTHLMEIWTLWHPTYWLSGAIKLLTAIVSAVTAILLVSIVPQIFTLPSPTQLEIANQALQREVSDRQQVERALRESEARFQAFMKHSPVAAWITNTDGLMLYANPLYTHTLHHLEEEVVGKTIFELYPTDVANHFLATTQHVIATDQVYEEIDVVPGSDGPVNQFLVYKFPISGIAESNLVGGVAIDITEHERTKEELRSLNDRLQYLLAHAPVMIFSCRADGDYGATFMSENVRNILGYESREFIESSSFWANHIHPEDRDRIFADATQIFITGQHAHDYRFLHSDGSYHWVYNQLELIRDETGNPIEIIGYLLDISDFKQAQTAVQQSEARYRAIVEDQTELIVRFQPDGTLTFVNDAYCRYFGMQQEELVGHRYEPVVFAEDREGVVQQVQLMTRESPTITIENRVVVGGEIRWTQWVNRAFFDEQGCLSEIQAVGRDIQALKCAEAALQESERRFRAIFNTMFQFIGLLKPDGTLIEANQTALDFGGLTRDEIINRPFWETRWWSISPETQAQLKQAIAQAAAGEFVRYEVDVLGARETITTIDFSLKPIHDETGQVKLLIPEGRDIHDRKQFEKQLELQAIIVKNIAEGICLVRATDGVIVYANPKFERMFGYDLGELTNQHVSILNYGDEARSVSHAIMQDIMTQGEATYEIQNVRKNGIPFWCQATTSVFEHPEHGTVFVAVQQDITEQKQANDFIKASLKEKEVLLKEIHHRVKNNLGIVDGLLQMQSRRSPNPQTVEILTESQNRIASIALVHEKLYRSEDLANIDFAQYIRDLTVYLFDSYNLHSKNIRLTTQVDPILLDIDRVIPCGLIVNELVSNALKYAFQTVSSGEVKIRFHKNQDQTLTLIVQDDGIGLPKNFSPKQAKTLGLSLVQGLVKQLKGFLEIDGELGTTVKITFREENS